MELLNKSIDEEILESPFDSVPNEVLEFILSFLPPYRDLETCMSVCRRWNSCARNVIRKTELCLNKAIREVNINWKTIVPLDTGPSITKRFSHSACIHDNSMFVFGGCTHSTAFNDLWRFDLSDRKWIRPMAMGTYPTPKAYATMIPYKEYLILFGGWTYPSSNLSFACIGMSSDVHFYNTDTNQWSRMNTNNSPPLLAGHSAVVQGDSMIIVGGIYKDLNYQAPIQNNCDVWVLNLITMSWTNQSTSHPKPAARHGQSVIKLNDDSLMMLGGLKAKIFDDCWILKMTGDVWTWVQIKVNNKKWSTTQLWCNPACRVGDKVVALSYEQKKTYCLLRVPNVENPIQTQEFITIYRLEKNMNRSVDKDNNVNGRRGVLPHQRDNNRSDVINNSNIEPQAGPSSVHKFNNLEIKSLKSNDIVNRNNISVNNVQNCSKENINKPILGNEPNLNNNADQNLNLPRNRVIPGKRPLSNGMKIIQRLRESDNIRMAAFACDPPTQHIPPNNNFFNQRILQRQQELQQAVNAPDPIPAVKKLKRNTMTMHVLDIASVLNDEPSDSVSWMPPQTRETDGAPEEIMMYSLLLGKGELIMFGGFHYHPNISSDVYFLSPYANFISNTLHFLVPPQNVI